METATFNELIQAGAAGLVILVVVLFLRFLSEERTNRTVEHNQMLDFITEQRRENNSTVTSLATAISTSLGGLTAAIDNLRTCTVEHHQQTEDAIEEMREKSRLRRKNDSTGR